MKSLLLGVLPLLAACASNPPHPPDLTPLAFDRIPQWRALADGDALAAFRRECDRFASLPPHEPLGGTGLPTRLAGTPADYAAACFAARQILAGTPDVSRRFFEQFFAAYDLGTSRLAGYFEPEFPGSLTRGGAYRTPVLARPDDLVTISDAAGGVRSGRMENGALVAYDTRAAIDRGALAGRGLELLWLADPIDLYLLQLQGAGRIRLSDGRLVRLAYAGKNGQPYVPIGRLLIERGLLAPRDATPADVRNWLEDHRDKAVDLMERNPSYVFFRVDDDVPPSRGAPGSLGVPLEPLHSIAVPRDTVPLGVPLIVDATDPATGPIRLLAFAQDSSADRDMPIFLGWGDVARARAALRANAHLIVLMPRPAHTGA